MSPADQMGSAGDDSTGIAAPSENELGRLTELVEQQAEALHHLRELETMRSDFLAIGQHELRTPLLAIMGQLELITLAWDRWDDAKKLEIIGEIDASTRMLSDLMETVIDFTRLSAETVSLNLTAVEAGKAVEAAVADIARRFNGELPVSPEMDVAKGLRLLADQRRLGQVLRNVIDNAVSFTPRGGQVRVTAAAETGARIRIAFTDTGVGIDSDALPRIFDSFFQEDPGRSGHGVGMGLAIVKALCDAHRATVEVHSDRGQGTEVVLHWPAAPDELATVAGGDGFHLSNV